MRLVIWVVSAPIMRHCNVMVIVHEAFSVYMAKSAWEISTLTWFPDMFYFSYNSKTGFLNRNTMPLIWHSIQAAPQTTFHGTNNGGIPETNPSFYDGRCMGNVFQSFPRKFCGLQLLLNCTDIFLIATIFFSIQIRICGIVVDHTSLNIGNRYVNVML